MCIYCSSKNNPMKKFILSLLIIFIADQCSAQYLEVVKSRSATNMSTDYLHQIANDFSIEVGNKLKQEYPARIEWVYVYLICKKGVLTLTYKASLEKCDSVDADWIFDHRGALRIASTEKIACNDAEKSRTSQMREGKGKFKIYGKQENTFWATSEAVRYNDGFAVVYEAFIVKPKM